MNSRPSIVSLLVLLGLSGSLLLSDGIRSPAVGKIAGAETEVVAPVEDGVRQEQQGRDRYELGDFEGAIALWKSAATIYETEGYPISRARVLSNLSLAYQQLGLWREAREATQESLNWLQNSGNQGTSVRAQALNTQGKLNLATGNAEEALANWELSQKFYARSRNRDGVLQARINQATALEQLGLFRRSLQVLVDVKTELQEQEPFPLQATVLIRLGNLLNTLNRPNDAREVLEQGLAVALDLELNSERIAALSGLGNVARSLPDSPAALDYYRQALALSPDPGQRVAIELAQLGLLVDTRDWETVAELLPETLANLDRLPPSHTTIYYRLNLGQAMSAFKRAEEPNSSWEIILDLYSTAAQQAIALGDRRAEAYALGYLANVYEETRQLQLAERLTRDALILSQGINAPDIAYRWLWQLGRIKGLQGHKQEAIAAYSEAVTLLSSLSEDIAALGREFQFSFQNSIEPVYRELASLLLDSAPGESVSQDNLGAAINVMESLQIAELDNFFQAACVTAEPRNIDEIDPQAAVIYPIILSDRLEVILRKPDRPLIHRRIPVSGSEVENAIDQLSKGLVVRSRRQFFTPGRQLYDWLIRPFADQLDPEEIKTLVFVPDGSLRNIPIATLYDGDNYLLETYNIAITPGLQLLSSRPIQQLNLQILAAGLTEERQGFSALDYVAKEMEILKAETSSKVLLNQEFTSQSIRQEFERSNYPIVHFATHGQFSSQLDETFILAWDSRISILELDTLLTEKTLDGRNPIELLVLSACQTASGDDRAALGLAGMAVRAGARSTVGTLWSVNDQATSELMSRFYHLLNQENLTKAEALRAAQLELLNNDFYEHPFYWSPYILVGNWL
ncbi:MAG: CHAT domain-containing protein [Limnospira sp.]